MWQTAIGNSKKDEGHDRAGLNQNEFRIATIEMFTSAPNAGVVPQMSPPLHDLERLRTTLVDCIVIFNRVRSVVSWTLYG